MPTTSPRTSRSTWRAGLSSSVRSKRWAKRIRWASRASLKSSGSPSKGPLGPLGQDLDPLEVLGAEDELAEALGGVPHHELDGVPCRNHRADLVEVDAKGTPSDPHPRPQISPDARSGAIRHRMPTHGQTLLPAGSECPIAGAWDRAARPLRGGNCAPAPTSSTFSPRGLAPGDHPKGRRDRNHDVSYPTGTFGSWEEDQIRYRLLGRRFESLRANDQRLQRKARWVARSLTGLAMVALVVAIAGTIGLVMHR